MYNLLQAHLKHSSFLWNYALRVFDTLASIICNLRLLRALLINVNYLKKKKKIHKHKKYESEIRKLCFVSLRYSVNFVWITRRSFIRTNQLSQCKFSTWIVESSLSFDIKLKIKNDFEFEFESKLEIRVLSIIFEFLRVESSLYE